MSFKSAQKTYSIKVTFKDETRRLQLSEQNFNFSSLKRAIVDLMPSIENRPFSIQWQDDEDDLIALSSDAELEEAIRVMEMVNPNKLLRFKISLLEVSSGEVKKKEKLGEQPIHDRITCDECGMSPIVGIRYKCAVRNNYDVCETCEAKSNHPYPFVKIVDPSNAPSVLFYAFQDENQPNRPPHHHPHPHHHHPHPHPHPHGFRWGGRGCRRPPHPWDSRGPPDFLPPSPFGRPFGRQHGPCRWEKKCNPSPNTFAKESTSEKIPAANDEEYADDIYDEPLPSVNPIRAAVEAFAKNFGAEESKEGGSDTPNPLPQQQQGNYRSFSVPQENLHKMASNIAEMASTYLEKEGIAELASSFLNAHMPGNCKPALRFVRHVTCPDGTLVPPSVPFCKTWRVRNDGKIAWPEGCVLVHSSGDDLTYEESMALDTLPGPGEEVDITINLKSPGCTGRFVSYFRMQTKEKAWFGQRLWTDIIVTDDETDWHVVGLNPPNSSPATTPANAVPLATPPSTASVPVAPAAVMEVPAPAVLEVEPETTPAAPLFARELRVLADMGFSDASVVMPLLHEYVENAENPTLGLERVIAALFSDEGPRFEEWRRYK
eukprot:gene30856-40164_t